MQLRAWRKQDPSLVDRVAAQATSGRFRLIGEIVLHGGRGSRSVSPASPLLDRIVVIAAKHGLPVLLHQFHQDKDDEAQFMRLLEHYPRVTFIWAHMCGFSSPDGIRRLFRRFPRLYFDLAWLPKRKRMACLGIVDRDFHFTAEWKNLLEEYPTRFLVGIDLTTHEDYEKRYSRFVARFRKALGSLNKDAVRQIASRNFHCLMTR